MKVNQCDICKENFDYVADIQKPYRFEGMEHICSDCDDEIYKAMSKIDKILREVKTHWVKKILKKMTEHLIVVSG